MVVALAEPPLLTYWMPPFSRVMEEVVPPESTVWVKPLENVSAETDVPLPETNSMSSMPPESVSPVTFAPLTTSSPPLNTTVPLTVAPERAYSMPPLEITVPVAVPPDETDCVVPLDRVVETAAPPDKIAWVIPEVRVLLLAVTPEETL